MNSVQNFEQLLFLNLNVKTVCPNIKYRTFGSISAGDMVNLIISPLSRNPLYLESETFAVCDWEETSHILWFRDEFYQNGELFVFRTEVLVAHRTSGCALFPSWLPCWNYWSLDSKSTLNVKIILYIERIKPFFLNFGIDCFYLIAMSTCDFLLSPSG